jgi:putative DNA primase/helicase
MNAPTFLKDCRGWLVWKFVPADKPGGKPRKVPYYTSGAVRTGTQGDAADRAALASYTDAQAALASGKWAGLGFAMLPDWGLVALDFDDAVDERGEVLAEVENLVAGTYAEWSPSGRGVHAFMRGAIADKKSRAEPGRFGFETFCGSGFLTFTGKTLAVCEMLGAEDEAADLSPGVLDLFAQRFPGVSTRLAAMGDDDDPLLTYSPPLDASDADIREWLDLLDANCDYLTWLQHGMSLHHETGGAVRGLDLWDEWSSRGETYPGRDALEAKWDGFGRNKSRAPVTIRGLRRQAMKIKHADDVVLDSKDLMGTARRMVDDRYQGDDGAVLIRSRGLWYRHLGPNWEESPDEEMRAALWTWLDGAKKFAKEGAVEPYRPSKGQVDSIMDALKAVTLVPGLKVPGWLPGFTGAEPRDLISLANGMLHIESRRLLAHTSAYFTLNSLPYGWDDECQASEWLKFLEQVFPGDEQSKGTLQEMFGYLLTSDTSHQKMFMVIGPKRSGKGTIGRVLGALVGRSNLVSPSLTSLTGTFGLEPLIDKLVALVPDARVSKQSNTQAIVERLLMVSGEDDISVDRKNKTAWSGRMTARFVVLTNETPQLGDSSGALAGRFVTLATRQSFYGKEDRGLGDRLMKELPGIFRWALDGLDRLRQRGYFIQPEAGREDMEEMAAINSPVSAFVKECCVLGPALTVPKDDIYRAWCDWCMSEGRSHPGTKDTFGKSLRAAFCEVESYRPRLDGSQVAHYVGVALSPQFIADRELV